MLEILRTFVAPLTAAVLTLWSAWLGFAGEADAELPRILTRQLPARESRALSARGLYLAHLSTLALAAVVAGSAVAWWNWGALGAAARVLLVVLLVWLVGDMLPRIVAALAPEQTVPARRLALRTLAPFGPAFAFLSRLARRAAPARPADYHARGTQRDMLLGVFSLADMTVSDVMTPRIDIVAVDLSATGAEVVATLRSSEHARLLVYDGNPDAVVGVIYAKDMLAMLSREDGERSWHDLIRPAAFVPEAKTLDRQLRDFQRGPAHLAVVVDEFGGTAGLVTLEDILEEIVGEIQDEYDTDEVQPIQRVAPDRVVVQGGVPLADLEDVLGRSFDRDDVSTVGGLILAELGRVPRSGEQVEIQGVRFSVDHVVRRRVRRVTVRYVPAPPPEETEPRA